MNAIAFERIMSLAGLVGLWVIWYFFWKPQKVDDLRQRLFGLRSDLFDLAAKGAVPFEHPAYAELRMMINGMIRFAHRINLPTLLLAAMMPRPEQSDHLSAWRKKVQKLPGNTAKQLLSIHEELSHSVAMHVIRGSFCLQVYLLGRVVCSLILTLMRLVRGKVVLSNLTVAQAKRRMDTEFHPERVTRVRIGAESIESRVLYEEHRRIRSKREHAYVQ